MTFPPAVPARASSRRLRVGLALATLLATVGVIAFALGGAEAARAGAVVATATLALVIVSLLFVLLATLGRRSDRAR